MPLVSVIIPTFDRLPLLPQAVQSVREQTLEPSALEIIVVDDSSTDDSWAWLQQQPDLRCVRLAERGGPSAARNRGAAMARGRYLAFLDSDDLFTPPKLALQLEALEQTPAAPLCHSDEQWLRNGKPLRQLPKHQKRGGWIFEHCLPMCRVSPSAAVMERELFAELGGFDEQLEVAEDYELWLRLTCQHPVAFVARPLVIKRGGHADQLSAKYGQIEVFRIEALRRVLLRAPLSEDQRLAALDTLRRKCEIYAQGCAKRGRLAEAQRYTELPDKLGSCAALVGQGSEP